MNGPRALVIASLAEPLVPTVGNPAALTKPSCARASTSRIAAVRRSRLPSSSRSSRRVNTGSLNSRHHLGSTFSATATLRPACAAVLYGVTTHPAPIDAGNYTVDIPALHALALKTRPKLITIGGSLNLFPHPIAEIRAIADEVSATVMFDAAHLSGMIAGRAWQQPLEQGAHIMTMSTYKSLGGPPAGIIVSNDASLMERIDAIAYPGLTANFDAAKTAALAMGLLDWKAHGRPYAAQMAATAHALADALAQRGVTIHAAARGMTQSHQFAVEAHPFGGGQAASKLLRDAYILACGIGLP